MPDSIERRNLQPFTDHEGIRYEGEVDNQGRRDGRGVAFYPDGTLFEGYFVEGKRQGRGQSIDAELSVRTGEWYNDFFQGFGICDFGSKHVYKDWNAEGYFFKNLNHGWLKATNVSGFSYEGLF